MIISLNPEYKNIQIDRTKVHFYKNFFKLEKNFDFNTLAFFLDRKEYENCYQPNGIIKLTQFEVFDEGKHFVNIVKDLLLDKEYKRVDTYVFASLSKISISQNHTDIESVFLFPLIGSVVYNIYDQTNHTSYPMNVGDLLVIPKNIVHAAIPLCPRIVISVGVFD